MRDVQRASAESITVDYARTEWEDPAANLQWTMGVGMSDAAHRVGPFLIIRTFLVEAFRIPTGNMETTLKLGDFLLVNMAVYGARVRARAISLPSSRRNAECRLPAAPTSPPGTA
jgi:hypothetical protein